MAGPAPELPLAFLRAAAQGQLFHLAHHTERIRPRRVEGVFVDVHRVNLFELHAGAEIAQLLSGVWYSVLAGQMALLADAGARAGREVRGIDNRTRNGIVKVLFGRSVAA